MKELFVVRTKQQSYNKFFFSKDLLAIEMKKKQIYMNKHLYLSLSVLEIRKIVMHEFWSDYMKQKYEEKEK